MQCVANEGHRCRGSTVNRTCALSCWISCPRDFYQTDVHEKGHVQGEGNSASPAIEKQNLTHNTTFKTIFFPVASSSDWIALSNIEPLPFESKSNLIVANAAVPFNTDLLTCLKLKSTFTVSYLTLLMIHWSVRHCLRSPHETCNVQQTYSQQMVRWPTSTGLLILNSLSTVYSCSCLIDSSRLYTQSVYGCWW